jgi:sRNA-binding protein
MANHNQASFAKRQRESAKRAKRQEKDAKRAQRTADRAAIIAAGGDPDADMPSGPPIDDVIVTEESAPAFP